MTGDRLLLGIGRHIIPVPEHLMDRESDKEAHKGPSRLAFMTPAHHVVRDFAVRELPRVGQPLSPQQIASELAMPLEDVVTILDDLERHLTFLYRNQSGAVVWAYPVTVAPTPHRIVFSSGETLYAA
jgi:hypothetical protein